MPVPLSVKVKQAVIDDICREVSSNDSCAGQDCAACIDRTTPVPSTTLALVEAAQLLQVQHGLICQIGTNTGLNLAAYLSANPTAHVISFERDNDPYTEASFKSLQHMFPKATMRLFRGDAETSIVYLKQQHFAQKCNFIYINSGTETLRDLKIMKSIADPDWHIVMMDNVSTNSGVRQAWLQAQYDGVLERVSELDDLLLPQSPQRSSPMSVQYNQGHVADNVTVLTNYTDAAVGRFASASSRTRQRFTRRVRIAASGEYGNMTADTYIDHTLTASV
jgi:hypothetical protein